MAKGYRWSLRVLLALAALVICAWFALGIRQAHDTARASTILGATSHLSAAQARHVNSLLKQAGQLNPDREVSLLRAQVARYRGDLKRAESIILQVVHDEPLNAEAWYALAHVATNERTYIQALIELDRLAPAHATQGH